MENTLKIKVFIKSILFCKYFRSYQCIAVQVPHLHQDGAPGHAGDHQCPGSPQVSQVVQVHNSGTENRAVDDNC